MKARGKRMMVFFTMALCAWLGTVLGFAAPPDQEFENCASAIRNNDLALVKKYIGQGVDVNARNEKGLSLLMIACGSGKKDIVEFLLAKGADVNERLSGHNAAALLFAADCGDPEIALMLIRAGADVKNEDSAGYNPLVRAAARGHAAFISLLYDQGGRANAQTMAGRTALNEACRYNRYGVVILLISLGVDVNQKDISGLTPLMLAVGNNNILITSMLLYTGADSDMPAGEQGLSPLHLAVINQNAALVELLLREGADTGVKDKSGKMPIEYFKGTVMLDGRSTKASSPIWDMLSEPGPIREKDLAVTIKRAGTLEIVVGGKNFSLSFPKTWVVAKKERGTTGPGGLIVQALRVEMKDETLANRFFVPSCFIGTWDVQAQADTTATIGGFEQSLTAGVVATGASVSPQQTDIIREIRQYLGEQQAFVFASDIKSNKDADVITSISIYFFREKSICHMRFEMTPGIYLKLKEEIKNILLSIK